MCVCVCVCMRACVCVCVRACVCVQNGLFHCGSSLGLSHVMETRYGQELALLPNKGLPIHILHATRGRPRTRTTLLFLAHLPSCGLPGMYFYASDCLFSVQ